MSSQPLMEDPREIGSKRENSQQKVLNGEVEHIHYLSEHIGALYLSDEYSDVTLIVENQHFRAHRVILAARSEYFRALLFGGMKESHCSQVELKNTPLTAFRQLLRYIYTGQMSLSNQKDDMILDVLGLAHQYGFQDLETSISDYLKAILSVRNVCLIYDTASMYALNTLVQSCHSFMDRHATEVILHPSFLNLSSHGIKEIISRDSFCAPECDIFKAVNKWVQCNPEESEMSEEILSYVRLSLMSTQDLLKVVRPTGLVPPDIMLDAIQSRTESRDMELKYRGCLIPEENIATPKHGAVVIHGETRHALLDGDTKNYDMEKGFTRHTIDETQPDKGGIVIQLGTQCIINHIRMLLWDREARRSYSYVVDVSMDQKDWVRVVDHSKFHCRSWQDLYFTARVVRYIRVIGTYNSVNKIFHAVCLEACYTKNSFALNEQNILIPQQNVATIPMSALVREGVCRSRNALLNGDTSDYNWDSGYTCHQLGSGSIVVQLGQPYALDSMRLLLWDCDDRSYSYYIEVSRNDKDWEMICDRSEVPCRSWQTITFKRRPVVYIKIVGTRNTANEVFHCVHFECPANNVVKQSQQQPGNLSSSSSSDVTDDETNEIDTAAAVVPAIADQQPTAASARAQPQTLSTSRLQRESDAAPNRQQIDGALSTASNYANFQEEEEEDTASVAEGAIGGADQMSHHSSPASCAGSVTGSAAGISANNSLPVGASACSIAREQETKKVTSTSGRTGERASSSSSSSPSSPSPINEQKTAPSKQQQHRYQGFYDQRQEFGSAHSLPVVSSTNGAEYNGSGDTGASSTRPSAQRSVGLGSTNSSPARRPALPSLEEVVRPRSSRVRGQNGQEQNGSMGGVVPRRNVRKPQE